MPNVDKPASNGTTRRKVASPRKTSAKIAAQPGQTARAALPKASLRAEIERRAYELWEAEGRPGGRDQSHWYRAEQELAQSRISAPRLIPPTAMAS
jgi:hypothetical protein